MDALINWNIARSPLNWFKIGLMAAFFAFGLELIYQSTTAASDGPAPNIDTSK